MSDTYPGLIGVPGPLPAAQPRPGAARVVTLLRAARMCVCDPTRAQSCPECDGTAAEERGLWREQRAAELDAARYGS